MSQNRGTLLLYVPVPHFRQGDTVYIEDQAADGLTHWAHHFDRVIIYGPQGTGAMPVTYVPVDATSDTGRRIEVHSVPTAYRPDVFLRKYLAGRRLIRGLIARADYLSFAIGGLFGDWGAVGAFEATRMKRAYAIWTDRVESEVTRRLIATSPLRQSIQARLFHRPMAAVERYLIRHAALGLFHGRDTFDAYAPWCRKPELVHDVHLAPGDHIPLDALDHKAAGVLTGPVKMLYVGRADAMKGPDDWLTVVGDLIAAGADVQATWLGDGAELARMRQIVATRGLGARVDLAGFVRDRDEVKRRYQAADLFLFCHKTPESPRCLIEALAAGTPIVGYDCAFAADLIAAHGGGRLVAMDDTAALVSAVQALTADRDALAGLMRAAAAAAAPFTEEQVFRHRAQVIVDNLPGPDRSGRTT